MDAGYGWVEQYGDMIFEDGVIHRLTNGVDNRDDTCRKQNDDGSCGSYSLPLPSPRCFYG